MADLTFVAKNASLIDADGDDIGTDANPLIVEPPFRQKSAFGDHKVVEEKCDIHLQFPYNINTAITASTVANGGTVTQASPFAVLQTSTANNGSALIESLLAIKYIPGQGINTKFTALFTAGVANSQQEVGVGDATDGFFFGYVGTDFAVIHRNAGVDTVIKQSDWNGDKFNGSGASGMTLDPTKGSAYMIQFQFLGFGAVKFFVENSTTGDFTLVHTIRYGNSTTAPSLSNPTLPAHARCWNSGNTSNLTVKLPSISISREGARSLFGVRGAAINRKTGITSETNLLTIKNKTTFASVTNKIRVKLSRMTKTSSADALFRVVLNATLGGTPNFVDFDTDTSVVSVDTAGTTRTGGRVILCAATEGNAGLICPLQDFEIFMNPGDTVTLSAQSAGGNASCAGSIAWIEEF